MRNAARELKATPILQCCDRLRDDVLPELGIRLEDREIGKDSDTLTLSTIFFRVGEDTRFHEKDTRIYELHECFMSFFCPGL